MSATARARLACLALAAAVLGVYAQVAGHEFVPYDTSVYLGDESHVLRGLTWEGARWALSSLEGAFWHPLTWLSHMLGVELFGLRPAGHHLGNVVLHAADACLVLLALERLTGAFWRSLLAAALFALHPLNAEPVAWIVERKGLLAAFFGLASLTPWASYARKGSRRSYAAALVLFAAGLMSKPTLVAWPFVLLLLDAWPLRRASLGWRRLLLEKLPFLALSIGACVLAVRAQQAFGAVQTGESLPLLPRLSNAALAYATYLRQAVWPAGLSFYYPHPGTEIGFAPLLPALLVLGLASVLAAALRRRAPWLLVGWLFFLGTLAPVIGLVQVGTHAHADRYAYLPLIGAYVAASWSLGDLVRVRQALRPVVAQVAVIGCLALGALAWRQAGFWKDASTLCAHALEIEPRNHVAHGVLGADLVNRGRIEEGIGHLRAALAIEPRDADARRNLEIALGILGQGGDPGARR